MTQQSLNQQSSDDARKTTTPRPAYMIKLGLLPPYSTEDVRQAYLERVRDSHPDHGGTPDAFDELERNYQLALEHVRFRSDRRSWISAHMDEYIAQQQGATTLRNLGAEVDVEEVDWVKQSFGDFATLTEYIVGVRLPNRTNAVEIVRALAQDNVFFDRLKTLDLSGCPIDDDLVFELRVLRSLTSLDLSRTQITNRALGIVHWLPALQQLDVSETGIGWWANLKTRRLLDRRTRQAGVVDAAVHPVNVR